MENQLTPFGSDPLRASEFRVARPDLPEDLYQPLYDRVNYAAAGASSMSFFSTPKGQSATLVNPSATAGGITAGVGASRAKGLLDTNLETAGVSPTKLYKVFGISVAYAHSDHQLRTNFSDRAIIRDNGLFRLRIIDKDILILPLVAIPELNPVTAVSTTVNNVSMVASAAGGGVAIPMVMLAIPFSLLPYQTLGLDITLQNSPSVASTLDLYVFLHSFMRRPT